MHNQADSLQYIDSESCSLSDIEDSVETDNKFKQKIIYKIIDKDKQPNL